jgi:Ca2+-transporting ATPase
MDILTENKPGSADWHRLGPDEVADRLKSSAGGLSSDEASRRLEQFGPNELIEKERKPLLMMFLDQFKDFMILVLIAAGVVAGVIGEPSDSIAIAVIVLLNAGLGFIQEYRAEKALAALKKMAAPTANVLRDGRPATIAADRLVPGDLVIPAPGLQPAGAGLIRCADRDRVVGGPYLPWIPAFAGLTAWRKIDFITNKFC